MRNKNMIWPETELTGPDPMLTELRAVRDSIGAHTATLSDDEFLAYYHKKAEEFAAKIGCQLIPHPSFPDSTMLVDIGKN